MSEQTDPKPGDVGAEEVSTRLEAAVGQLSNAADAAANQISSAADNANQASDKLTQAADSVEEGARNLKGTTRSAKLLAERIFLNYQSQLRVDGTKVLNEAMLVLDIIDTKTTSLLQYISVSLAVMIFLWGIVLDPRLISLGVAARYGVSMTLLMTIILLLISIIICLSCLNIVGAHTIKEKITLDEYEETIVRVTNSRRNRYRVAHKLSVITAVLSLLVFLVLAVIGLSRMAKSEPETGAIVDKSTQSSFGE